ncbi:hypothetical protein CIPAW_15G059100 [Carya illinoinensis]|uniref:Uncharacterized protein n=1 Tax=Carya illinoinensis TaxID=32201 RepID=A0A8T1N8F1_CARIL|nr:hypothetical protein CIPAW_15G059100 [Carya illinoinensis]
MKKWIFFFRLLSSNQLFCNLSPSKLLLSISLVLKSGRGVKSIRGENEMY